jgi:hypothetical protein
VPLPVRGANRSGAVSASVEAGAVSYGDLHFWQ